MSLITVGMNAVVTFPLRALKFPSTLSMKVIKHVTYVTDYSLDECYHYSLVMELVLAVRFKTMDVVSWGMVFFWYGPCYKT